MSDMKFQINGWYKKYKFQIFLVLGLRVCYSIWLAIVWIVIDKYIPLSEGVLWETYYNLERSSTLLGRAFIDVWLRWDAVHYMNIAEFGYEGVGVADTVFFPLYPYFVGMISKITSINVTLIGILSSSIFTIFALIYFFKLVILLFNDEKLAKLSVMLLALFPTAFFLHAPYTEAMFLFFSIGSIFYVEKKELIIGSLFACAASLARPQGLLLLIPISISLLREYKRNKNSFQLHQVLSLLIAPSGIMSFSLWRANYAHTGLILSINKFSNITFQDPISTLYFVFISLFKDPSVIRTLELISVVFFLYILIWMFRKKEFRTHLGILLYSSATWLLITSKTSVNNFAPRLTNRYVLFIFFAFVGIAYLFEKFNDKKQKIILFVFLIINLLLLTLYTLWVYIG
jgi:Gpi18-like mannosyltransferase